MAGVSAVTRRIKSGRREEGNGLLLESETLCCEGIPEG